jgi:hypothetical protein
MHPGMTARFIAAAAFDAQEDLALHFLPLHIGGLLPDISLTYNGETRNLAQYIEGKIDQPVRTTKTFDADDEKWTINLDHIYVDPTISTELRNSYMLTAHGRLVGDPTSITRKFALDELANGKAYVAVVSGEPLDARVDQQRLGFRFNTKQRDALEVAVLGGIGRSRVL